MSGAVDLSLPIPSIIGVGLATPLGNDCRTTWDALCAGRAIADHARVAGIAGGEEPRVNALALRVAREAIAGSGWTAAQAQSAALIVGTSKGAADDWLGEKWGNLPAGGPSIVTGLADIARAVAAALQLGGPRLTYSGACASGLLALIRAAMMIRAGETRRAIVVAAESSLHPLFIGSFQRLGVLAPPAHGCRPFDRDRAGFLISEAAAAICLEALDSQHESPAPFAIVEKFAMAADAFHLTSGDPKGGELRRALARVIDRRPVELIHAHGTGTLANDPVELAAIEQTLAEQNDSEPRLSRSRLGAADVGGAAKPQAAGECDPFPLEPCNERIAPGASKASAATAPDLYSHKGALGHSLGAAGLVAVAINCMMHRHGIVPPNVRTTNPMSTTAVFIDPQMHRRLIRRSLAISAGFGGAIAAVALAG